MTQDDLKDIKLDHEAVYHAQSWDVEVVKQGDRYVLRELPDDPQRCVDAVPRLLAEVEQLLEEGRQLRAERDQLAAIINEAEGADNV